MLIEGFDNAIGSGRTGGSAALSGDIPTLNFRTSDSLAPAVREICSIRAHGTDGALALIIVKPASPQW